MYFHMTVVPLPQLYEQMSFDLNDPKYFLPASRRMHRTVPTAIPTLITKWLFFRWLLKVAVARVAGDSVLWAIGTDLSHCRIIRWPFLRDNPLLASVVYATLATFLTCFSFHQWTGRASRPLPLKRSLYAFAVGLIYLGWWFLRWPVYTG